MTRSRAITLASGVVALFIFSAWRLFPSGTDASSPNASTKGAPLSSTPGGIFDFSGQVMGTTYSVRCELPVQVSAQKAQDVVQRALDEVDSMMSTYKPQSELSRLNAARAGEARRVSQPLLEVLRLSEQVFVQTGGAFDVTVGPLVNAWGFGSAAASAAPSEKRLEEIRASVGFSLLKIDAQRATVEKMAPDLQVDLSAIAKGYGVDRAADSLSALGVENFLIEVGGELRFLGDKPGASGKRAPWIVAIEEPVAEGRRLHATFSAPPSGGALATSGDYRNFREEGGALVSHILDPRSGKPAPRRTASVSVYRPRAAEADALATALFVLSPGESLSLAEEHGWAVYLLIHRAGGGFESRQTRAFERLAPKKVAVSGP
jgi:thiamine biosynthesis lipoprotein